MIEAGNFFALLQARMCAVANAPFLTPLTGDCWTYGAMDDLSSRIAGALISAGAKPGDRIAVQVDKSPQNVALYLASLRAGFVYVPLNTAYTPSEIDYFITDAEPAIFICGPARLDAAPIGPKILTLGAHGEGSLLDSADNAPPFEAVAERKAEDLAVILYTSGTTGRSKGAMLTHNNLAANALALHKIWGFRSGDVLLHALPIFHIHGLFVALHTMMLNGSEVIFLPNFNVNDVISALPRATVLMGVPTFYTRLLESPRFDRRACTNMRLFISGSAPLNAETFKAFEDKTGFKILERYGMSEAGMIASNPLDGARVAGTVGYPLPGVDVRIAANGAPPPPGEAGMVEVRGPNVFKGYWKLPEKTAAEFREGGWFATGDIGFLSGDGRLTLSGRARDLIIVGGFNVYPKEIEETLDALPGIAESAVIGAPHPDMGEGVVAVLVPAPTSTGAPQISDQDLSMAVSRLARFKQPRKFVWIDGLPRNAMGKVSKQVLREKYKNIFQTRN